MVWSALYMHGNDRDSGESVVIRVGVPASYSSGQHLQHDVQTTHLAVPFSLHQTELGEVHRGGTQILAPTYGVFAVTERISQKITEKTVYRVYFSPAAQDGSRHLQFQELFFYEHPFQLTQLAAGVSGRYAAITDLNLRTPSPGSARFETSLGLVRYAAYPTAQTTFHRLDTASADINVLTATIALDDALGVVYLANLGAREAAKLYVLSYA